MREFIFVITEIYTPGMSLRFQVARYKYNKSVGNQTTRDFFLFYFPMKVGGGHIYNSWGKFLAPGS